MINMQFKTVLFGVLVLLFADFLFAFHKQTIPVDDVFDDSVNGFEQSWYYFDDNAGVAWYVRPQSDDSGIPSIVNVPYTTKPRHAFGNLNDTFQVKEYSFAPVQEGKNSFATLPFTFGSIIEQPLSHYYPFVGVGTKFALDGDACNLDEFEYVKFKARSRKSDLKVTFIIQTLDIEQYSLVSEPPEDAFCYPETLITVTTSWSDLFIPIGHLKIPQWGNMSFEFDKANATKLVWMVNKLNNDKTDTDTLDLDDVYITNDPVIVKKNIMNGKPSSFQAFYRNSRINVYWSGIGSLSVKILNVNGKTIWTAATINSEKTFFEFPELNIAAGLYIISATGHTKNGKTFLINKPISIVK